MTSREDIQRALDAAAAARECGGCTACCTVMGISELAKPAGQPCPHECEAGCAIYTERPASCAAYVCVWRQGWGMDEWRPDRLGVLFAVQEQPGLYEWAGGAKSEPSILVAQTVHDLTAFATEPYLGMRARWVRIGVVLVELHEGPVPQARVFGPNFPEGRFLALGAVEDGTVQIVYDPK